MNYCPNCGTHLAAYENKKVSEAKAPKTILRRSPYSSSIPRRRRPKKTQPLGKGHNVKTYADMSPEEKSEMKELYE